MPIIQNSVIFPQHGDWKNALAQSIRSIAELFDLCAIDADPADFPQATGFALRVTRFYASLIEKGNIDDPLLRQVLPVGAELIERAGYSTDAVGDGAALVAPGLIHKYPSRVLLTLTGACAIHCRYCFRRHFAYAEQTPQLDLDGPTLEYIRSHGDLREVILSGGDPLMQSDERLEQLVDSLNRIDHLALLRVHSRLASVLPQRLDRQLIHILGKFKGTTVLVTHINHANEINRFSRDRFLELHRHGIRLLNQSVLLRGVNDDDETLARLSYALFDSGITPYYLHCLDKVQGAAHFDVDRTAACTIHRRLRHSLPGYLVPRLVEEIAGRASKTQVQCERYALSSAQTQ